MARPSTQEYAPAYEAYIGLVPEVDILPTLRAQHEEMVTFLRALPESQGGVRHPPYTWSVKEVVGHITDAERIFGCRALRFARNDPTPLPAFEENDYVRAGHFDRLTLASLVAEFDSLRRSHVAMFGNLPEEAWSRRGEANRNSVTVRALTFIIAGHARHHFSILRKRLA